MPAAQKNKVVLEYLEKRSERKALLLRLLMAKTKKQEQESGHTGKKMVRGTSATEKSPGKKGLEKQENFKKKKNLNLFSI